MNVRVSLFPSTTSPVPIILLTGWQRQPLNDGLSAIAKAFGLGLPRPLTYAPSPSGRGGLS
jgi:hypothetical protein